MNYLDASVLPAQLLAEDRVPPGDLWEEALVSSRLTEYEVWNRVHSRGLAASHGESARLLLGRLASSSSPARSWHGRSNPFLPRQPIPEPLPQASTRPAWSYRHRPKNAATLRARQRHQPAPVIAHAWKTQHRLHALFDRLAYRKPPRVVVVAVARELAGFR